MKHKRFSPRMARESEVGPPPFFPVHYGTGLLNIYLPWHVNARRTIDVNSGGEWSKKSVQQGRSPFDARSVHSVREHGKRARTPLAAFFNIPGTVLALWSNRSTLSPGSPHLVGKVRGLWCGFRTLQ